MGPFQPISAAEYAGTEFKVIDPVIVVGGSRVTSTTYTVQGTTGWLGTGESTSTSYKVRSGFEYFAIATVPALTATARAEQVALSWTASTGYLGWTITSYDVCYGTSSNSYGTCTDVGNVTSKTVTGLTAGTTYYFRVRAKTVFSVVIVRSNEASAVPTAGAAAAASAVGVGGAPSSPPAEPEAPVEPGKPAPPKLGEPLPAFFARLDLNKDLKINLIDFSILFYWWNNSQPSVYVDFNGDGKVSIVDLSILIFAWTG